MDTRTDLPARPSTLVTALDAVAAPLGRGEARRWLSGELLGHPLHPMLTDLPIGFWTSSMFLDLTAPRSGSKASRRLIAVGLLSAVPAAMAGLSDVTTIKDPAVRAKGALHAALNGGAVVCYGASWVMRHRNIHRGKVVAMVGGVLATAAGYLGGQLAFPSAPADAEPA